MKTFCISNEELSYFFERELVGPGYDLDLTRTFEDILRRANQFVPSEAGLIFVDVPRSRNEPEQPAGSPRQLVLVACYGPSADRLVSSRIDSEDGIVGTVYRTGQAYIGNEVSEDELFYAQVDAPGGFTTRSVICVPLSIRGEALGVLELLNHLRGEGYTPRQLELMKTFAQTISASIHNAVEAQRSKEMARRDDLTGLYNDRYMHYSLTDLIAAALHQDSDCALIFLDLDHFKNINDAYGHLSGSRVLAEVGQILRQVLPGSAIAARYGGDEFVVILPEAGKQEAYWVAETVRKNIEIHTFLEHADAEDPVNYPALAIADVLTCSLGVATLDDDVLPLWDRPDGDPLAAKNELIRVADQRMYRAKDEGRNRIAFAEGAARRPG